MTAATTNPAPTTVAGVMAKAFEGVFAHAFSRGEDDIRGAGTPFFHASESAWGLNRGVAARYASRSVPARSLDEWFEASRLPRKKDLFTALCVNASTLSRMRPEAPLEPGVTERLLRQSDLLVRAAEVFGDQGPTWMTKPHPLLDGKTPIEFATNEYGGEKVRSILNAIEHGGVV
ncbi:antitoxin Xre/MbcA/ParS toxin-binding domain-containing protein [Variovorax ginsengisoli]|uniref:DUF2384 domain-containing protein n=1 Tax=Variovorax ginsengisoli TaxID=363844 RepID=A0ABT8SGA2_9BURK|nr:antitoxin Xre/MbcA/ParS toxin-binding domain-containing protein [Variovorax ginsengisoli]MDN8618776.1 DUF2384 domain-containing protein [Variovorax ginsengisoli]MDO1537946.1 DUF2384 domain-containing protein [Variovorax ginsengisoli]